MAGESRKGVLAFNLGTPEAPDRRSVARFLREFLSDSRVVDLPRWLWLPLLHLVIAPLRAGRSAAAYAKVWRDEGSPLLHFSRQLVKGMQTKADAGCELALGMRYGHPSIREALEELRNRGARALTVLPLYPQYSYTTTASGYDAVDEALAAMDWNPPQERIQDYRAHPSWVSAVAGSIRAFQGSHGSAERLLFSMHGIPQRYVEAGDPYQDQCEESVEAVVKALGLEDGQWMLVYQSRLGREPWLQPYTDQTIEALAREGVRHVQVVCPGFAVDCLETLEEIAMENRERFEAAGGEKLEYIPALNDSDAHVQALLEIIGED
jgi:ferrochelatase